MKAALFIPVALLLAVPAHAQLRPGQEEKSDPAMVGDVATTPLEDLNIESDDIPPLLLEIQDNPYSVAGIGKCGDIIMEVNNLNSVLGPDYDALTPREVDDKRRDTVGSVGKTIVGGLIPFRSLVREVTGAAGKERRFQQAIYAGVTRRAFLKGLGQQRKCKYPARPGPIPAVETP